MARDASTQAAFAGSTIEAVLDALFARLPPTHRCHIVGLSGLPGSGKTTLARQLVAAANARGVRSETLSLDDFYLGQRERRQLARDIHPLLATRGVPGTHDLDLLARTLAALAHAKVENPVRVARFDKGRDTRLPPSRWRRVTQRPRLVLLEGWCIGVPPQAPRLLRRPLNALERCEDADARWRRFVNAELAGRYAQLWQRLDTLVELEAPGFAVVERWRTAQERVLRARQAPRAMDVAALHRFLMHFERCGRHALHTLPARADLRIALDADHDVRAIIRPRRKRAGCHTAQRNGSTTTAVP